MRKSNYRGAWQRLTVDFKIEAVKKYWKSLDRKGLKVLGLRAMIAALDGKPLPSATRISEVSWENPGVLGKDTRKTVKNPDEHWLNDESNGLPTLNRGGWLREKLQKQLDEL